MFWGQQMTVAEAASLAVLEYVNKSPLPTSYCDITSFLLFVFICARTQSLLNTCWSTRDVSRNNISLCIPNLKTCVLHRCLLCPSKVWPRFILVRFVISQWSLYSERFILFLNLLDMKVLNGTLALSGMKCSSRSQELSTGRTVM